MIRDQLSPIALQAHVSQEEIAQALAFSCLSYYTSGEVNERSQLSFRRAWGDHYIVRVPPTGPTIGIHSPGWIAAIWNDGDTCRLLLAVQGLTSASQLTRTTITQGFFSWPIALRGLSGRSGHVYGQFKNQADEIWAAIAAHPQISPILAMPRCAITFVGHSLGAAIAEVMASNLKYNQPQKRVRLIKFASPRIGTRTWAPFSGTAVPMANVLCGRDPIHFFPFRALRLSAGFNFEIDPLAAITFTQHLCRDDNVIKMRREGPGWSVGYGSDGDLLNGLAALGSAGSSNLPESPWFDHHIWSYRLAMMQYCASIRDAMELRFNYLEMPNETQWQFSFQPGRTDWRNWFINAPVESDHLPQSVDQESTAGGGGEDYGHELPPQSVMQTVSDDAGGGGQNWGGMPSALTVAKLPRRRRRF